MRPALVVAGLTLREALHRKVLLAAAIGIVVVLLPLAPAVDRLAALGFEADWWNVSTLSDCVVGVTLVASALALVLGASGVTSAERSGLLASIVAGPVSREAFVLGRALGLLAVPAGLVVAGMSMAVYLLFRLQMQASAAFWWGLAEASLMPLWLGAMALGFNGRFRPVVAGGIPLALVLLRETARQSLGHASIPVRVVALLIHYAAPSQLPGTPLVEGLRGGAMQDAPAVFALVLIDNMLWGVLTLAFGAWALSRRDIAARP